jgi:hypothetical protein
VEAVLLARWSWRAVSGGVDEEVEGASIERRQRVVFGRVDASWVG